jgi:hypothetical protein
MNNYLAMNICEAIMPIKDDSVNVTIVTNNGNVYNNVEVNDLIQKVYILVMINMHLMLLTIRLLKSMLEIKLINDIDYEDIYDNINDYEYPYNHINRDDLV